MGRTEYIVNAAGMQGAAAFQEAEFLKMKKELDQRPDLSQDEKDRVYKMLDSLQNQTAGEVEAVVMMFQYLAQTLSEIATNPDLSPEGKEKKQQERMSKFYDDFAAKVKRASKSDQVDGVMAQLVYGTPATDPDPVVSFMVEQKLRDEMMLLKMSERLMIFLEACRGNNNPKLVNAVSRQLPKPYEPIIPEDQLRDGLSLLSQVQNPVAAVQLDALQIVARAMQHLYVRGIGTLRDWGFSEDLVSDWQDRINEQQSATVDAIERQRQLRVVSE